MYHDQVLSPMKALFEQNAINVTLGLPFLIIKYVPSLIKTNKDQARKIAGFCLGFSISFYSHSILFL